MAVAAVIPTDEVFLVNAEMPALVSSTAPVFDAADHATSSLCLVTSAQSTSFPGFSVVETVTPAVVGASNPVLPELSCIFSAGLALTSEPQVGEAGAPSSEGEESDGFERQAGGNV